MKDERRTLLGNNIRDQYPKSVQLGRQQSALSAKLRNG